MPIDPVRTSNAPQAPAKPCKPNKAEGTSPLRPDYGRVTSFDMAMRASADITKRLQISFTAPQPPQPQLHASQMRVHAEPPRNCGPFDEYQVEIRLVVRAYPKSAPSAQSEST